MAKGDYESIPSQIPEVEHRSLGSEMDTMMQERDLVYWEQEGR